MKIEIGNLYTTVLQATEEEKETIYDILAFELPEQERIRDYKMNECEAQLGVAVSNKEQEKWLDKLHYWRDWDGKIHLYDRYRRRFPSGLVYVVLGIFEDVETHTNFSMAETHEEITSHGLELYPFQQEIVKEIIEFGGRCIIDAAVGSGKTEIALFLLNIFKVKALIIVPNATLEKQWVERIKKHFNIEKSDISRLYKIENKDVFLIATRSFVHNVFYGKSKTKQEEYEAYRLFIKECGIVIIDEVHNASSKQYEEIMKNVKMYHRIGLTGTVDMRTDKTDIIYHGYLGPNVGKFNQEDLIRVKRAIEPTIIFKSVKQRSFPRHKKYPEIIDEYIVENDHRNSLIVTETRKLVEEGRKVLIITDRIRHIHILTAIMELDESIGGQVVGIEANSPNREEAFEKWMRDDKELMVMICTVQLIGEGFDMVNLQGMVLAGSWKSKTRSIQTLGRLIRKAAEKHDAKFIDFFNNCEYLWEHSVERAKTWKSEGFNVITKGTAMKNMPDLQDTEDINF